SYIERRISCISWIYCYQRYRTVDDLCRFSCKSYLSKKQREYVKICKGVRVLKIEELIYNKVKEHLNCEVFDETQIYGPNSELDSLGLVNLLVDIEQEIYENFNTSITIASEKAMSQNNSPFRNYSTLKELILNEYNSNRNK